MDTTRVAQDTPPACTSQLGTDPTAMKAGTYPAIATVSTDSLAPFSGTSLASSLQVTVRHHHFKDNHTTDNNNFPYFRLHSTTIRLVWQQLLTYGLLAAPVLTLEPPALGQTYSRHRCFLKRQLLSHLNGHLPTWILLRRQRYSQGLSQLPVCCTGSISY